VFTPYSLLWSIVDLFWMCTCGICVMSYLYDMDMAPSYLSELCRQTRNIEGRRQLRSATRGDLDVPRCRLSTYSRRAFSCAGPAAWNSLADRLMNSILTIEQFSCLLKSFFLATSYKRNIVGYSTWVR